ncbi:hypothetical protein [Protaetiibacter intestinalis]|uniref:Transporter n=1 Tax=Protaetiibacter intestinalis TaxID=2419774 RepID=A0A387B3L8_9MICO|nr:hypothetical protein [Protaetiibacter intestinalis]AYF98214.1 hypothetical protein D7I47_08075 [Protaetiibacter intestinalis]
MVATVLRLRFRILGNQLASSPWQLVGFVFGALAALGALSVALLGLVLLPGVGLDGVRLVMTIVGALLVVGWAVAPLVAGGVDTTIDAARLAPFPLSTRQVMLALTAVGFAGVPGIVTGVGVLAGFIAWVRWPVALAAAVVCLPLAALSCVLVSRTVASFTTRAGRLRNAFALVVFGLLVMTGPILTGLFELLGGAGEQFGDRIVAVVGGISWTPVGAVWAVPGDLAAGAYGEAAIKFAIAVGTVAALWLLWRRNVRAAVLTPPRRTAARGGRLGWFGILPTGGTGATWARSLKYWLGDPRYLRNLVIVVLLPGLFAFAAGGLVTSTPFAFAGVLPAVLLGLVPYVDVAFDGTAFATVLATGIRGRADRAGRLLGALTAGGPLVVVIAVVTVGLSGNWMLLPGVLGTSLGALLAGLGICAVSSAFLVIPVPASGDNIFKRVPGQGFVVGLAFFGLTALAGLLTLPALALTIAAAVRLGPLASWAALLVGLAIGAGAAWGGIVWGGRIFDRGGATLLARVRATSGY